MGRVTTEPDPLAEWWSTADVAAFLEIQVATVSAYRLRGQMPPPDMTVRRTQMWRPATIIDWHRSRPGVGGRKPQSEEAPARAADTRWVVHGTRNLYTSEWIRLDMADIELPDGQRYEHHTVWMPPAAMTALLNDAGTDVLLLWRHRFVPDLWNWELPGGLIDAGEDPAATAAREIEEETGLRPRSLEHLVTFEPMIGMVKCPHHVYLGRGAEKVGEPTEKTEMERMQWVPLAEVPDLIRSGEVLNSGSLVALLHVLALSGPAASH